MLPVTPSKKALTDNTRNAIDASNTYRDSVVPEELHTALQNLGSRVRKSVLEGFGTQHLTAFSVPATPYSTPTKLTNTQTTPTSIFRSANDAFNSVFPPGGLRVPLTPSPKKRPHAESEHNGGESRPIRDSDMDMDMDTQSEVDEDQPRPEAPSNVPRIVKPLRRSIRTGVTSSDPFKFIPQDKELNTISRDITQNGVLEMDLSEEAGL